VGTRDDFEDGDRPCDPLIAMWPAAAREQVMVRYVEGATHGFDSQTPARQFYDEFAHGLRGGMVSIVPNPTAAAAARRRHNKSKRPIGPSPGVKSSTMSRAWTYLVPGS